MEEMNVMKMGSVRLQQDFFAPLAAEQHMAAEIGDPSNGYLFVAFDPVGQVVTELPGPDEAERIFLEGWRAGAMVPA